MYTTQAKPFYLLDPNSPLIDAHRPSIEVTVTSPVRKLAFSVAPEVIELRDITGPQEIILALQHFPQHIEKMLGTLHFDFEMKEGSELFIPEADWKKKPRYLRWFRAMSTLEVMPFFVQDKDVRLYMLAGDYLAGGRMHVTKRETGGGRFKYELKGRTIPEFCKRLFNFCNQFMMYCHGTGFDPKEPIIEMLADYTLPVHYIDVLKQYQKDMKDYKRIYSTQESGYRFKAA